MLGVAGISKVFSKTFHLKLFSIHLYTYILKYNLLNL